MSVTRDEIDAICADLPGARFAPPPELISWKVGGKMFACMGDQDGVAGVSVKCPDAETARMLIEAGEAQKAKYFHASWVRLPCEGTDLGTARRRLLVSYDIVRASLTKTVRESLPPREGA